MHNLYNVALCSAILTCNLVWMPLFYLHAKLRLFVFVATMLHLIGSLLEYVAALFVTGV